MFASETEKFWRLILGRKFCKSKKTVSDKGNNNDNNNNNNNNNNDNNNNNNNKNNDNNNNDNNNNNKNYTTKAMATEKERMCVGISVYFRRSLIFFERSTWPVTQYQQIPKSMFSSVE